MDPLDALSPLDGRYSSATKSIAHVFCERALIETRIYIELSYLENLLSELVITPPSGFFEALTESGVYCAEKVKNIESTIRHDVKAVEYHIRNVILELFPDCAHIANLVHFGLTSEDINNMAYKMMLRTATFHNRRILFPEFEERIEAVKNDSRFPMLARTHGQLAYPTTFENEMNVFLVRFQFEKDRIASMPLSVKFGGAVGNLLDHYAAFPDHDWHTFADNFVTLHKFAFRQNATTQNENNTDLCAIIDGYKRMLSIVYDLCQDMWLYISHDYITLQKNDREVGSSVMAHKINPIDFENAMGNCRLAISLFETLSRHLPVSMLQRDLSNSTMMRSLGSAFGHFGVAMSSCMRGLERFKPNRSKIDADLAANWQVYAGVYQNAIRAHCPDFNDAYEIFKKFSRGGAAKTRDEMVAFIATLPLPADVKDYLLKLDPPDLLLKIQNKNIQK